MADQDPNTGAPGARASAKRFAQDLRAIREKRGVSLDDVQHDTRMPADILGRFEEGDLIGDQHYNEVYLRNLLKSYAGALGISPQEVLNAYDQAKSGAYEGGLRQRYLDGGAQKSSEQPRAEESEQDASAEPAESTSRKTPRPPTSGDDAPAVAALSSPRKAKEEDAEQAEPARTSATRPKRRVSSAKATSKPIEKSWGIIAAAVVGALVVIALILWFLFRDPRPEPELAEVPAPADTTEVAATDTAATESPEPAQTAPQFQTPIQLSVVAGENALENFRVQVDDDARRPYWMNPGTDTTFTAQQRIAVWGELEAGASGGGDYDGAVLRLQGLEWTPPDGRIVRINQQTGQALLDSLHRVTNTAPTG